MNDTAREYSHCNNYFLCVCILQDGNHGEPKVKRLKAIEDVGMTSSDSDEKGTIYGALVVLG